MIFDSHAHYDDEKFDTDRVGLLLEMKDNNIGAITNVGASFRGCKDSLKLASQYDFIYAALGIHPEESEDFLEENLDWIKEHLQEKKVVALGEIGLDYYWCKDEEGQARQRDFFIKQLKMADDMPVIIHSRDACEDTMTILKEYRGNKPTVVHCFSYSPEIAEEYVKMGYYIGVGGVVTFKNGRKLVETVEKTPLERILIETDCPYLTPVPHRGERNSSLYLRYVIDRIAEIKGIESQQVEETTWNNAVNFYRIEA